MMLRPILALGVLCACSEDRPSAGATDDAATGTVGSGSTHSAPPDVTTGSASSGGLSSSSTAAGGRSSGAASSSESSTGAPATRFMITGVSLDASTHRQLAPGSDNFPTTWASNGELYTTWGDGGGFGGTNEVGRVSLGFARIEGSGSDYTGFNVWGGAAAPHAATFDGKSYGLIAIDDTLWAWVGVQPGNQFARMRLYRSNDFAQSWQPAGPEIDTATLAGGFTHPNIVNFGPGNADAPDDFVYTYWSGAKAEGAGSANHVLLSRTPSGQMADLEAYEYWTGDGWSADPQAAGPTFTDAGAIHWVFRVCYIAGLRKYVNEIQWLQADDPWGPWSAITTQVDWMPPGATPSDRYVFFFDIPTKWQDEDGLRFTYIFSGRGSFDSWNTMEGEFDAAQIR